jgi:hypothetical protein
MAGREEQPADVHGRRLFATNQAVTMPSAIEPVMLMTSVC